MDSSDPNRNPSDVSSNKNIEDEKVNPSPESCTEEEAPAANASPPEALALMPQPLDDREYGCKYCTKKFSNKQALGGHQNAHKIERAMEKNPRDPVPEGHFPYGFAGGSGGAAAAAAVGGDTLSYTGLMMMMSNPNPNTHHHHFLGSSCNNRSHEFVNRSTTVNWPYSSSSSHHHQHQQQQQQQQQQQLLNQRQALQIRYKNSGTPAYVAPRPLPGYSNVNSGWTASRAPAPGQPPRVSNPYNNNNNNNSYNYPGQPSYMQNQNQAAAQVMNNSNLRLHHPMTIGGGGGGAMMRPGSHQGFGGGPRIRPGNMVNPGGENRNTMMVNQPVNEQAEDSDMDLSLKL